MNIMALSNYPVVRFREYAESNNYQFTYGRDDFQNWLGDQEKIYKVIYLDPIESTGEFTDQGSLADHQYSTSITLACKSQLHENYEQKYDRYLQDLSEELDNIVKDLICNYKVRFTTYNKVEIINQFDVNVDGISANIVFFIDEDR